MRAFRFRAQPALDLRRREDDEAQRILARAQADFEAARRLLDDAAARADEARARLAALLQEPGGFSQQLWYRSWILRLDRERSACAAAVTAREADVARASAARVRTQQRVKALDRLKEKGRQAWARDAAAAEQKDLDALATIRYVVARGDARTGPDR